MTKKTKKEKLHIEFLHYLDSLIEKGYTEEDINQTVISTAKVIQKNVENQTRGYQ